MISRRGLIGTLLAAPAIIRTPGLLMPVKPYRNLRHWLSIGYEGKIFSTTETEGYYERIDPTLHMPNGTLILPNGLELRWGTA